MFRFEHRKMGLIHKAGALIFRVPWCHADADNFVGDWLRRFTT